MAQPYGEPVSPGNRRFGEAYLRRRESIDEYEERRRRQESVVRPPKAAGAGPVYGEAKDVGAIVQEFGPEAARGLIEYARYEQRGGVAGELGRMTPEQRKAARIAGRRLKYESRARADQIISQGFRKSRPGQASESLSAVLGESVEELEPGVAEPELVGGVATGEERPFRRFRVGDVEMTEQGIRNRVERKLMERGRALGGISGEAYTVATGAPGLPRVAPKLRHIEGNTFLDPQTNTAVDVPFTPQQKSQLNNRGWVRFSNEKGDFVYRMKDGKPEVQRLMKKPPKEKRYDKTVVPGVRDAEGRETTKIIYTNPDKPSDKFVAHEEVSAPEAPKPSPPPEAFGFETDADGKKHAVIIRLKPDGKPDRTVYPAGFIPKGYESQFKESKNVLVVKTELEYPKAGSLYEGIDKDTGKKIWEYETGGEIVEGVGEGAGAAAGAIEVAEADTRPSMPDDDTLDTIGVGGILKGVAPKEYAGMTVGELRAHVRQNPEDEVAKRTLASVGEAIRNRYKESPQ